MGTNRTGARLLLAAAKEAYATQHRPASAACAAHSRAIPRGLALPPVRHLLEPCGGVVQLFRRSGSGKGDSGQ